MAASQGFAFYHGLYLVSSKSLLLCQASLCQYAAKLLQTHFHAQQVGNDALQGAQPCPDILKLWRLELSLQAHIDTCMWEILMPSEVKAVQITGGPARLPDPAGDTRYQFGRPTF
jgi:hypothetical protein